MLTHRILPWRQGGLTIYTPYHLVLGSVTRRRNYSPGKTGLPAQSNLTRGGSCEPSAAKYSGWWSLHGSHSTHFSYGYILLWEPGFLDAQIPPAGQRERSLLSPPLGPAVRGVSLLGAAHVNGWKTILSQELISGLSEGSWVGIDGPGERGCTGLRVWLEL